MHLHVYRSKFRVISFILALIMHTNNALKGNPKFDMRKRIPSLMLKYVSVSKTEGPRHPSILKQPSDPKSDGRLANSCHNVSFAWCPVIQKASCETRESMNFNYWTF